MGNIRLTDVRVWIGGVEVSHLVQGVTFPDRFALDEAEALIAEGGRRALIEGARDDG